MYARKNSRIVKMHNFCMLNYFEDYCDISGKLGDFLHRSFQMLRTIQTVFLSLIFTIFFVHTNLVSI